LTQEVELKLELGPDSSQALLDLAIWQGQTCQALNATYFDTPGLRLKKAGLSLRLRQGIQTLKAAAPAGLGLFERGEWENQTQDGKLDLDQLRGTPLEALGLNPSDLLPIIQVDVERCTVMLDWRQSRIEVSLDRGTVWANDNQAPICELELELLDGKPGDLFDLARWLGQTVRLIPARTSKVERGYALLTRPGAKAPDRPASPDIFGLSRGEAFYRLATDILGQVLTQSEALRRHRQAEAVHQLRVALRRLRALISLFKSVVSGPDLAQVKAALRDTANALGPARDLDVLIGNLAKRDPAPQALIAALSHEKDQAYEAACHFIEAPGFGLTLLSVLGWLEVGYWRTAPGRQGHRRDKPIANHARKTLRALRTTLKIQGRGLSDMTAPQMHALRIRAKKLRYGLEMFASLYPKKEQDRQALLRRIKTLQDQLGAANDKAVGLALISAHAQLISPQALTALTQRLWPDHMATPAAADKTLQAALSLPRFWTRKS
jgi:inorganic triphosphatase YgiF